MRHGPSKVIPRRSWVRLAEYIPAYEAVNLAGRFGADPGDYEWEWLSDPEGIRWWRRDATGRESLFGMAVAVHRNDLVELYGLVEVDETSSFWADVIPEEGQRDAASGQTCLSQQNRPERCLVRPGPRVCRVADAHLQQPGQPLWPRHCPRGRAFHDALKALIERASHISLPSEAAPQMP
jgi:hypothetical protein